MSSGANKSDQTPTQDRADTFKANGVNVRKASRFQGRAGTPDPNGDGSRPKGRA